MPKDADTRSRTPSPPTVDVCHDKPVSRDPLLMKIGDRWVDCERWKRQHPGGAECLERYAGRDATDAFSALHGDAAWKIVGAMKPVDVPVAVDQAASHPDDIKLEANFRSFRRHLKETGWFDRSLGLDVLAIGQVPLLSLLALLACSYGWNWVGAVLLGLSMLQGGWVAHDYLHARSGPTAHSAGSLIALFFVGMSPGWWTEKHSTHHVHPNQHGIDDDIANEPILFLTHAAAAAPGSSSAPQWQLLYRRYQHIYCHAVYALLFVLWRIKSLAYVVSHRRWNDLGLILLSYMWLALFPLHVSIAAVLLAGWIAAEVVTASHQGEEMFDTISHRFVRNQFAATCDVLEQSVLMAWLWGGMNYQTIHHLFPSMPRYYYGRLVPHLQKFATDNSIQYKTTSYFGILKRNYETMRRCANPVKG